MYKASKLCQHSTAAVRSSILPHLACQQQCLSAVCQLRAYHRIWSTSQQVKALSLGRISLLSGVTPTPPLHTHTTPHVLAAVSDSIHKARNEAAGLSVYRAPQEAFEIAVSASLTKELSLHPENAAAVTNSSWTAQAGNDIAPPTAGMFGDTLVQFVLDCIVFTTFGHLASQHGRINRCDSSCRSAVQLNCVTCLVCRNAGRSGVVCAGILASPVAWQRGQRILTGSKEALVVQGGHILVSASLLHDQMYFTFTCT